MVFLEDESDFLLLKILQYSTISGLGASQIDSGIVFRYARDRDLDELQLFELVQQINWRVNERNTKHPQD